MLGFLNYLPAGFLNELLAGQARHLLTLAAGYLITSGVLTAGDQSNFVRIGSGIVVGLLGMLWSAWQKSEHKITIAIVPKNPPAQGESHA